MSSTNDIGEWVGDIHKGDVLDVLNKMPSESVDCVVTSPPYWQLRDYGEQVESVWGGNPDCEHDWQIQKISPQGGKNINDNPPDVGGNQHTQTTRLRGGDGIESKKCLMCQAWRGQLGLEPTVEQYVQNMVTVGRAIERVLQPEGSWWLNIGDTYDTEGEGLGLGRKQKSLVPQRVGIGLQEAGWTVRNDVTWEKTNPTPNPVDDRLNTTTEVLYHMTKNPQYYYDLDSVKEPRVTGKGAKNPGDVITTSTEPYPEAHFAVFPPEVPELPIKATCPPGGVVLDPFAGSGTTLVVAENNERDWIGIDLNSEYVDMAEGRIRAETGYAQDDPLEW